VASTVELGVYFMYLQAGGKMKHDLNIIVWVDDIIISGQRAAINKIKAKLKQRFNVKDLGPISHFLGMRITRNLHPHTI
jgi:hypothetical protein